MRALVMVLAIALPISACGKSDDAEGEREGAAMTANAISSNDITAIDAVTGESANIAADVVIDANLIADANEFGNDAGSARRPRRSGRSATPAGTAAPATANQAAPAPEPQSNSAE